MKDKKLMILTHLLAAILAAAATVCLTLRPAAPGGGKLEEMLALIQERYIGQADPTELEDAAAQAMVAATSDRWSYYIPAKEYEAHMEQMNNAYVGVGITITQLEDNAIQVIKVTPGSSAQEAGIQPGDILVAVEGQDIRQMDMTQVRGLVRGEEGTSVQLTLEREGKPYTCQAQRRTVQTPVATWQLMEGNVGLITIANFDARCAQETIDAVEALLAEGAEKLIFDVRNNPGGYADEMVEVLDYLLPEGDLFRTVSYNGSEHTDVSDAACLEIPMAVLVNSESYSAAEFFAAALQEYQAAVVVGERTSGKGHFQNTFTLSDGSALALSVGKYFTPQGKNLEGVGIVPDSEISVTPEQTQAIYLGQLDPAEDPQIQGAIAALAE